MSDSSRIHEHEDVPRFEPWLAVMSCAFLPALAGLFLPGQFLVPMIALTVPCFAGGAIMLRRQRRPSDERGRT